MPCNPAQLCRLQKATRLLFAAPAGLMMKTAKAADPEKKMPSQHSSACSVWQPSSFLHRSKHLQSVHNRKYSLRNSSSSVCLTWDRLLFASIQRNQCSHSFAVPCFRKAYSHKSHKVIHTHPGAFRWQLDTPWGRKGLRLQQKQKPVKYLGT